MRILHLCTYDAGGAGNAAIRLHEGLLGIGVDSVFASKRVTSPGRARIGLAHEGFDWRADYSPSIEFHLARLLAPTKRPVLAGGFLKGVGLRALGKMHVDLIHLHWVDHGMVTSRDLAELSRRGIPIVWTMHDLSPASGGFGFREGIGLSPGAFGPLIRPGGGLNSSARNLHRRENALRHAKLTAVAPSAWLTAEAERSPVFANHRVEHIPNGIDTDVFAPTDRQQARARLGLPADAKVILFGADTFEDTRKGISHLQAALQRIPTTVNGSGLMLVGFGNKTELKASDFPIPVRGMGRLSDQEVIASLYSAADVFVCPSREDNLPNTMVESLSCGTPVVGFEIGGLTDLVIPGKTGFLAPPFEEQILATGIETLLGASEAERLVLRSNCRRLALEKLTLDRQAKSYLALYRDMLIEAAPL